MQKCKKVNSFLTPFFNTGNFMQIFYNHEQKTFYGFIDEILHKFNHLNYWEIYNDSNILNNTTEVSMCEAITLLQKNKQRISVPVGVIGTNKPTDNQYILAKNIGELLAKLGFTVICGGRLGVMKTVCEGVALKGGISIGILPNLDANEANEYVSIPITTGIGLARNTIIAAASICLIAIGGSCGTLSEMAFGLQYNKLVLAFTSEFQLKNIIHLKEPNDIIPYLFSIIFRIKPIIS